MKKFIYRLFFFLFPILILVIIAEIKLQNIANDYSYKSSYLLKNAANIEVLFLGNSHSYYGIDPLLIDKKSFNASHVSQSLAYDYEILRKFNPNWKKLKIIAIPISYFSLHFNVEGGKEAWREKNYCIYYDIYRSKKWINYFEISANSVKTNYTILNDNITKNKDLLKCSPLGWKLHDSILYKKDIQKNAIRSAKRHTYNVPKNLKNNLKIIDLFITFARNNNCKLYFYTAPVTQKYFELLSQKQLDQTHFEIGKLVDNKTIFYKDFMAEPNFVDADFYDADHLNPKGAAKFSKIINQEINSLQ